MKTFIDDNLLKGKSAIASNSLPNVDTWVAKEKHFSKYFIKLYFKAC